MASARLDAATLARHVASPRWLFLLGAVALAAVFALGSIFVSAKDYPILIVGVPIAVLFTAVLAYQPFLGLLSVVVLNQVGHLTPSFTIELATALTVIGVALHMPMRQREERRVIDEPAVWAAVLYVLAMTISMLFAREQKVAVWAMYRQGGYVLVLCLTVYLTNTPRRLRWMILALLGSTALSATVAVLGYGGELDLARTGTTDYRQAGLTTASPTASSHMMVAAFAMAAILFLRLQGKRLVYGAAMAVSALGAVVTFARSAGLGLVLTVVLLVWKFRKSRYLPLAIVGILLLGMLSLPLIPTEYWERFGFLSEPSGDPTLGRRLGYHVVGFKLLATHPIFGVGPRNFPQYYLDWEFRTVPGRYELKGRPLHNMFLSIPVESGLLGFACFASLLMLTLRGLHRARARAPTPEYSAYCEALQLAIVVFLFVSLFQPNEYIKFTWILLATGIACARVVEGLAESEQPQPMSTEASR